MTPAHGNPRPVEPRLAPRFHALLAAHPPQPDHPRTQERAEALLADAVQWKASDIHLEPSSTETRLRFRIDGVLHDAAAVPGFSGHRLAAFFKTLSQIDALALARPEHGHGRMEAGGTLVELRTTVAPTTAGEMIGMRLLDTNRPLLQLDHLGMLDDDQQTLREWLEGMQGMLLVGGPVGSGKTSTLYALLHELQKLPRSILTVEDPVESSLDGITQIEVNVKRGLLFPEAIRAMLRLDPDFLLVGEIRDPESAHVAITAAGSGHALLSTIHARDAVGTVTTLRNVGAKNWEIAAALEVAVSQRLVRRLCPACKEPFIPGEPHQARFAAAGQLPPELLYTPRGCHLCAGTGFSGRIGIFELWRVDAQARQLVADGADDLALARHALHHGLRPLLHDAMAKVAAGHTSLDEIKPVAAEASRASTAYAVS
jgi:type II secretory ATPase GspE/PulE/Tfp pilus assembly ATPase PilB-like protein